MAKKNEEYNEEEEAEKLQKLRETEEKWNNSSHWGQTVLAVVIFVAIIAAVILSYSCQSGCSDSETDGTLIEQTTFDDEDDAADFVEAMREAGREEIAERVALYADEYVCCLGFDNLPVNSKSNSYWFNERPVGAEFVWVENTDARLVTPSGEIYEYSFGSAVLFDEEFGCYLLFDDEFSEEGIYTLSYVCYDYAAEIEFGIDLTAPVTNVVEDTGRVVDGRATFAITASDNLSTPVLYVKTPGLSYAEYSSEAIFTRAAGEYLYYAADEAGNMSEEESYTIDE